MAGETNPIPGSCQGVASSPKGLGRIIVFDPTNDPKATTGGIRIALVDHQLVVKLFDTLQGEKYSVKLWTGATLDQVAAHWRMYPRKGDLTNQEFDLLCQALTHWMAKAERLALDLAPGFAEDVKSTV